MMMVVVVVVVVVVVMVMCKRLAQVPMLCVPTYNIKLAMMPKTPILPRFQHIRRWPPTSAGKARCLAVKLYPTPNRSLGKRKNNLATWRFSKMGVPLNHPLNVRIFQNLNHSFSGFSNPGDTPRYVACQESSRYLASWAGAHWACPAAAGSASRAAAGWASRVGPAGRVGPAPGRWRSRTGPWWMGPHGWMAVRCLRKCLNSMI